MEHWTYVNHKNIDRAKYNKALNENLNQNTLYAQDFVWDILHPGWDLLISGDYSIVVPIPHSRKWLCTTFRQPIFIRTIPVIGRFDRHTFKQIQAVLEANCAFIHLNFSSDTYDKWSDTGTYQLLELQDDISNLRAEYATNAKRILKKHTDQLIVENIRDAEAFILFFKRHVGFKYSKLTNLSYSRLKRLMNVAFKIGVGTMSTISYNGMPIAMAFFIDINEVRYYVKGASSDKAKELGAMFHLIDHGIETAIDKGLKKFDFVGSNANGVADFNKKFGAKDMTYGVFKSNELKWPLSMFFSS